MSTMVPEAPPMSQDGLDGPVFSLDFLLDGLLRLGIDTVQRIVTGPAERLKVLTTVEGELRRQGRLSTTKGFGGIRACARRIWQKEGTLGFLRGMGTDLVLSLPAGFIDSFSMNLVALLVQAAVPQHFSETMGLSTAVALTMSATALAVMVASPYFALRRSIITNYMADIVAPTPLVADDAANEKTADPTDKPQEDEEKGSLETEGYLYDSATETVRSIYRRQGLRAFYRGALVDPILVMIYRGLYVGATLLIPPYLQEAHPYAIVSCLSLVSDVAMQPFEVVSRRLILTASDDTHPPYDGVLHCMKTIVHEEGATGLWSGLRCRIVVNVVGLGIRVMLGSLFAQK